MTDQGADRIAPSAKVMFVIHRRADLSREACLAEWKGAQHVSIVKGVPGLRRWVQSHVVSPQGERECDGIGELWFDDATALEAAMQSEQMGQAVEDAKRFLDMDRTYAVVTTQVAPLD